MPEFEMDIIRSLRGPDGEQLDPGDIYRVDKEGVFSLHPEAAQRLFDLLSMYPKPVPEREDYDPRSGLHKDAQFYTFTTKDGRATLTLTNHGAMAIGYRVGDREILYPPRPAGTSFALGDILRGGDITAHPHTCGFKTDEVNYHGTLARSLTVPVLIDEANGVAVFAITPNLIPENVPDEETDGMLTLVVYKLNDDGSYTKTVQTFNSGTRNIYTVDAFHPYFDTRTSHATGLRVGEEYYDFREYREAESLSVDEGRALLRRAKFDVMHSYQESDEFPSLILYTPKYSVNLKPLRGFDPNRANLGIWTEDYLRFFCLEIVEGSDAVFDPEDPKRIPSYTEIKPGESSVLAVHIKAELM